jgi:hypothetical protein
VIIAGTRSRPPSSGDLEVRALAEADVEAVVDGTNAFHAEHVLYPRLTADGLWASLAITSLGMPIRQHRIAANREGRIVAGAGVSERYLVMVDHIDRIPLPLAVAGRLTGMLPADRTLRTVEVGNVWHAPGEAAAARHLWDAIRHEWRGRATSVAAQVDPRSPLFEVLRVGRSFAPRIEIMVPVRSPVAIDERASVYLWR